MQQRVCTGSTDVGVVLEVPIAVEKAGGSDHIQLQALSPRSNSRSQLKSCRPPKQLDGSSRLTRHPRKSLRCRPEQRSKPPTRACLDRLQLVCLCRKGVPQI